MGYDLRFRIFLGGTAAGPRWPVGSHAAPKTHQRWAPAGPYMTKLGTVVHNENTVPLKSSEEKLNFSSCSMNVGELFIRFICCDRAVPASTAKDSFCVHEIVELAVSCLLRTAFSVSDVVLLPIPSVYALFCSLNRQRWGFKNMALISRNPGIPLYISASLKLYDSMPIWSAWFQGSQCHCTSYHLLHLIHTFTILYVLYHSQDHLLKTGHQQIHLVCWCSFIELFIEGWWWKPVRGTTFAADFFPT